MLRALVGALTAYLSLTAPAGGAQTNLQTIATDGAWTWFNDPRALFHHGTLYVGHVRSVDGRSVLTAFNPATGQGVPVWTSSWSQADDHDNAGLLPLSDGRLMAFYAQHSSTRDFAYRTSLTTNPTTSANWGPERIFTTPSFVTYANPFQLTTEGGRIYNFIRDLNFNPTFLSSSNLGTNWTTPVILIQTGTGSTRPYVKYASDYTRRIDFLYTDGHPRDVDNSLYHAYYENGAINSSDGAFLKYLTNAPLLHDSGERGSVIYQYSSTATSNYDDHIPSGRAWCWDIVYQTNRQPACVFTVQRDGAIWSDDRIYYYYARWTGTNWQKRFIAHAGRPLYSDEDDYAGGISIDPEDANVIYLSSNAADPFNTDDITNVPLRAGEIYEIYRGVTQDGGLTFAWTPITVNSTVDNLRPYVPRNRNGVPAMVWFRGTYTAYNSFNCEVVALLTNKPHVAPSVRITNPIAPLVHLTNAANKLLLWAIATDDGEPGALTMGWSRFSGPANAVFSDPASNNTLVSLVATGTYVLRFTASDGEFESHADVVVHAGLLNATNPDALWLKLDETSGNTASDSSGSGNTGTVLGPATWLPNGGQRNGALRFNGTTTLTVNGGNLDNTAAFTLAYWFRADAWPPSAAGLVSKREGPFSANAYTTYLDSTTKRIHVDVDNQGASNDRFTSASTIQTGAWYHVAVVFDGSLPPSQRVKLWLNGALDVIATETSAFVPFYGSAFRVGNMPTQSGLVNWLTGVIDDVRFYRRALNATEILALAVTNAAPAVNTGAAPNATNGVPTTLNGVVTDDNRGGALLAWWTQIAGSSIATFQADTNPASGVTFNRRGGCQLRLCATDSTATICDDLFVTVSPNANIYEDWIELAFPGQTNSAVVGFGADPDGDKQPNLLEFAYALDPAQPEPSPFEVKLASDRAVRVISRRRTDSSRLDYQILASSDLNAWQPAGPLLLLESVEHLQQYDLLTYRLANSPPERAFFKVSVRYLQD